MAAVLSTLLGILRWRWTPFFALLGGSMLYILLVVLLVPAKLGAAASAKAESLNVVGDEPSPLTASMGGRNPRSATPRGMGMPRAQPDMSPTRPPEPGLPPPSEPPPGVAPLAVPPPPVQETEMRPPPEAIPPPTPPPQPPAAQDEDDEPDEDDDEDLKEQGALPPPAAPRAFAGALRMLPPMPQPGVETEE